MVVAGETSGRVQPERRCSFQKLLSRFRVGDFLTGRFSSAVPQSRALRHEPARLGDSVGQTTGTGWQKLRWFAIARAIPTTAHLGVGITAFGGVPASDISKESSYIPCWSP
jgi:hypothetical protein